MIIDPPTNTFDAGMSAKLVANIKAVPSEVSAEVAVGCPFFSPLLVSYPNFGKEIVDGART
eukprot:4398265-Pyramimonas_sp.AAC.1